MHDLDFSLLDIKDIFSRHRRMKEYEYTLNLMSNELKKDRRRVRHKSRR